VVSLKTERELTYMRKAGSAVARILGEMADLIQPGLATIELDKLAEARCRELGVVPAFKGYHGFPACVCVSVNEEVVHGIPSAKRTLKKGDIVGLDFGVSYEGWYGDSARTIPVGAVAKETQQLLDATSEGLKRAIEQCHEGNRIFDIGHAVQNYVEPLGYSVVREFVGHGIGRSLHEEPQIPNYGPKGKGMALKAGMVLAIEPMVNAGSHEVRVLADGWTAVTADRSLSAHFEHTVAITSKGPEILTLV